MVLPPRLNLRRAASYNHDRGPLSSTSSRFNFNHLLFSPPPSPSLPALVPRPKKSPVRPRPSRVIRLLVWSLGVFITLYFAAQAMYGRPNGHSWTFPAQYLSSLTPSDAEFEMVGQDDAPDFPTPIVTTGSFGRSKWTVSIPPGHPFPLPIREYADMMGKCREVSSHARSSRLMSSQTGEEVPLLRYDESDPYFVDVGPARATGLLPSVTASKWATAEKAHGAGHFAGVVEDSLVETPVCERSLTFVLETQDAGLGNTLMLLWTLYSLAQDQGRAFFIDDTRWAYGLYTDAFRAPPIPTCRPPPRHEMIPCPIQARHLVVSAATAKETLFAMMHGRKVETTSAEYMFDLARRGYEALFHLNKDDGEYVTKRVAELRSTVAKSGTAPVIGLHIRRGDCHPLEHPYRDSYVPPIVFAETLALLSKQRSETAVTSTPQGDTTTSPTPQSTPLVIIASDDPTIYATPELAGSLPAQTRIRLAGKPPQAKKPQPNPRVMHRFVDEAFGWEGGFFSAMFWNLGLSRMTAGNAAARAPIQKTAAVAPSAETIQLRSLLGRAYLLDLTVLATASDSVVCTVGAMGCRILAVMMGWEKAIEHHQWVNIDGDYGWAGLTW